MLLIVCFPSQEKHRALYFSFLGVDVKNILIILVGCLTLAGCYQLHPDEGEISTVPVTNNPNAMPGSMQTSPMPSIF